MVRKMRVISIVLVTAFLFVVEGFRCYPNKEQDCHKELVAKLPWKTSVRFFLFTRKNPDNPELLHVCHGTLPNNTNFNPKNDVIVFIQGYALGICELDAIGAIKNELLEKGDYNVIVPECGKAYGLFYSTSVENAPKVAEIIGNVLINIQVQTGIRNDQVYLIGISLGAQTAGMVGQIFKVRRITGLDPVRMSFDEDKPLERRLDPSDAELVDVIHCNGGNAFPFVAIDYPAGDADFFVNGGSQQPKCSHDAWTSFKKFKFWYAIGVFLHPTICSHAQCLEYFRLSINSKYGNFTAWSCDSYEDFEANYCRIEDQRPVLMGFDFEKYFTSEERQKPFPRKYYLKITSEWPYVSNSLHPE